MARPLLLPRWTIVLIDLAMCLVSLLAAYQLRFNFSVPPVEYELLWPVLPLFIAVRLGWYLAFGIQRGMVRHTGTEDAKRVFLVVLGGSLTLLAMNALRYFVVDGQFVLPTSVIIIDFLGSAVLLIASRIAFKLLHLRRRGQGKDSLRVVLFGAGEAGLITKRTLEREGSARYAVAAFVDDDPGKVGKRLEGVLVHGTGDLAWIIAKEEVDQVIIAIQHPDPENRRRVVDTAMHAKVAVRTVPPVRDWINGQLSSGQIREVRIEDLLGRAPIHLEEKLVQERFRGRVVMVTGAAGSIGAELCRQLAVFGVERLVMLDLAESALYEVEMELRRHGHGRIRPVVGDVRDREAMDRLLAREKPEVVLHAAAYKHVPLMEAQPVQAVLTNVGGTVNLAELCREHAVKEFILISTDKAVNPTSVMGASKRCAEIYVQALPLARPGMSVVVTRFGNVLGSNGSVIPLFRRQIAEGGPVTVTDPEVTRFFMTIPEACRLVLEAATMGKGGEIYLFDMGKPVRIADLADRMIRLSGLEPGKDIEITYTGLRPGEKLYEELLAAQEGTVPTHHPRILIGHTTAVDPAASMQAVKGILAAARTGDGEACVRLLKALIPEYRSNNSIFGKFDAPTPQATERAR
ncbi:MAG: polysaccharide biosynthesis protein [Flavobacteriales bacterium]|nr:polysaccharide biosynthesis protein [Flavobacteriales bacterium]MEB2341322.1 nucleoside-diphosphate sugar epimerase/dehydratase [Flavobacteriia bacterium]